MAILITVSLSTQAQEAPSAFTYVSKSPVTERPLEQGDSASSSAGSWKIQLNKKMTKLVVGSDFELAMPNGEILAASVETYKEFDNGDIQLQAGFGEDGHVILTMGTVVTYGSITSSTHNYSFSVDESNNPVLLDNQALPAGSTDLSDDMVIPEALDAPLDQSSRSPDYFKGLHAEAAGVGKTNIDILFVYSPEFKTLFTSPETRINQLIAFSNASYDATDILINMRMVGAVEIAFTNNAANGTLLTQVSNNSGVFSVVSQMRNDTGADLVAVLGTSSPGSASGIAFVLNSSNGGMDRSGSGFSFTRLSTRCCDTVFAHEIGHNLGSGHEGPLVNPNANISRCSGGFTGFSCGHGNTEPEAGNPVWGTIMSNISSRAVIGFRFSNLDNTCAGEACGIAPGLPGPEQAADNRTSFNMSRMVVGAFRNEAVPPPEPQPSEDCTFFLIQSDADKEVAICL